MTGKQLEIIQHSLGVDKYGQLPRGHREFYRNYFCAGGTDVDICRELVEMGYAETFERASLPYFNISITQAGISAMRRESQKPPRLTRAQLRYQQFLEADCDMSFGEWLKANYS